MAGRNKAAGSNVKDPENRSRKDCVCGNHSTKSKNAKPKGKRKSWQRKSRRAETGKIGDS